MKNLKNALLLKQLYQLKHLGYHYTSIQPYQASKENLILPDTLDSLQTQAKACHLCPLSKSREKVVFGTGNPQAEIMFVGDEPSSSDDSVGQIFTGRSGELLKKMIENVLDIAYKDVYLSNILKCHRLETEGFSAEHAESCLPYIEKEIRLVKPKIVIALGQHAYRYLSHDETALEEIRGIAQTKEEYILIATHHPSYILRNPSSKKEVFEDLKKIKGLISSQEA